MTKTYGKAWVEDGYICMAPTSHVAIRLRRIFPRARVAKGAAIELKAAPDVCREIEWVMQRWPMELSPDDRSFIEQGVAIHEEIEETADAILGGKKLDVPMAWEAPKEAHPDQISGADLALATGKLMVADDIGMGKTLTAYLTLRDPTKLPALVVCQTHLPKQFLAQLEEWTPLRGHIARVGTPYPIHKYMPDGRAPDVLILPYSKLSGWQHALRGRIKAVLLDEVQELRRAGSQKYVAAQNICELADLVAGFTATPVYNYGEEVFNIFDVIAPGSLGERAEFFREWGAGYGSHMGVKEPGALAEYLMDQRLMIRRTWADRGVKRFQPQKVPVTIESDDDVLEKLVGDDGQLLAETIATRNASRKELFVMSGDFDWRLRKATGVAKAPYVADFVKALAESGEKVMLFGWHHDVYEIWKDKLKKYNPVWYTGRETPNQKSRSRDRFLHDKNCKVFIMSLRSGAGLDGLQKVCNVAVFGELDWSPAMHDQGIGRLDPRRGLEKGAQTPDSHVTAYFLVSENGSDPTIADTLRLKRGQSEPFLDPGAQILETQHEEGRIRRLAEDFLRRQS